MSSAPGDRMLSHGVPATLGPADRDNGCSQSHGRLPGPELLKAGRKDGLGVQRRLREPECVCDGAQDKGGATAEMPLTQGHVGMGTTDSAHGLCPQSPPRRSPSTGPGWQISGHGFKDTSTVDTGPGQQPAEVSTEQVGTASSSPVPPLPFLHTPTFSPTTWGL